MTLKKQENQKPKVKKYYFRKFIKELKRVRWP
ncbi:preprotein translocase subunit SecE, partial [Mycoplasmopsis pullorum]